MSAFLFQSCLFFLLGLFNKKNTLSIFIFLILSLPYSNAFSQYISVFGLIPYMFFFLGDLIISLKLRKSDINTVVLYFIILLIVHFGIPFSSLFFDWKIYLKDIFPILIIIVFHFWRFSDYSFITNFKKTIKYIIIANFIMALFMYLYKENILSYLSISDEYYITQFRYVNLFIYITPVIIYFRDLFSIQRKNLILIFLILLMSGSRTILFFSLIAFTLSFKKNYKTLLFIFTVLSLFAGFYFSENLTQIRSLSFLNYEQLKYDLFNRFSPFFIALSNFELYNYIIGNGAGYGFYIPWFEYRDNINNYNVDLDNFYFTSYAKYGLLSIPLYYLIYIQLKKIFYNRIVLKSLLFLFLAYGFTNSFIYQAHFSGVLFFMIFLDKILFIKNHTCIKIKKNENSTSIIY